MNLPPNIQEALENGRLKRQHPIKYQVFQLLPLHKQNQQVLIQLSDEPFEREDDAHMAVARVIESHQFNNKIQFTILPVIVS